MEKRLLITKAAEAAIGVVEGVRPDQFGDPTPCPEFDARAMVNHLFNWTGERARRAAGKEQQIEQGPEDHDEVASPGWAERYAVLARATARAWSEPEAWTGMAGLSGTGEMPADFIGSTVLGEFVLHGWDLAKATGQKLELDDDLTGALWEWLGGMAEMARKYKVFGPEVPVPESAPLLDRALGLAGRDPDWVASY